MVEDHAAFSLLQRLARPLDDSVVFGDDYQRMRGKNAVNRCGKSAGGGVAPHQFDVRPPIAVCPVARTGEHRFGDVDRDDRAAGAHGALKQREVPPSATPDLHHPAVQRGEEAGLREFSPHDLRRTYISVLLDRGVDLATAADLAGHASPNTTKRYDRRGERARHAAAD